MSAVGIMVVGPEHDELQMARDADAFRSHLEQPGRQLAAALLDVVFAASYGLLGIVGYRVVRFGERARAVGIALVAVGAACDEIENGFLVRNIAARATVTDGWIDAMQVPGTLKWVSAPALAVLMVRAIVSKLRGHAHGAGGEA